MKNIRFDILPLTITVLILFILGIAVGFYNTTVDSTLFSSVEVGITSVSSQGASGGLAIPASCPSFAHNPGDCAVSTFGASPETINQGDSVILSWECPPNAVSSAGINFSTGGELMGSVTVSPTETTTYTLVCTDASGAMLHSVTVTVTAPIFKPIFEEF